MIKAITLTAFLAVTTVPSGCQTTSQQKTIVLTRCPIVKEYTKQQLQRAAKELGGMPSDSELVTIINDYSQLRDACKAITKQLKK